jgi:hypothetical protein
MKDPLGHGSDGRGAFRGPGAAQYKVEKHVGFHGVTAAGQKVTTAGNIWQKIGQSRRQAVAEKLAQFARVDDKNARVRIK